MFFDEPRLLEQTWQRLTLETFCQVIMKSVQWFLTRRFFKFSIKLYRENKPRPLAALFFYESKWLEQSWYRITKGTFMQNYIAVGRVVSDKMIFLSFLYRYNYKISPAPWRPWFLTNPNGLNNLGRGSPKEHFCKIIWKLVQWFLKRRLFKFSI